LELSQVDFDEIVTVKFWRKSQKIENLNFGSRLENFTVRLKVVSNRSPSPSFCQG